MYASAATRAHFSVHDASVDAAGTRASRAHQTAGPEIRLPPLAHRRPGGWVRQGGRRRPAERERTVKKTIRSARSGHSRYAGPDRDGSLCPHTLLPDFDLNCAKTKTARHSAAGLCRKSRAAL